MNSELVPQGSIFLSPTGLGLWCQYRYKTFKRPMGFEKPQPLAQMVKRCERTWACQHSSPVDSLSLIRNCKGYGSDGWHRWRGFMPSLSLTSGTPLTLQARWEESVCSSASFYYSIWYNIIIWLVYMYKIKTNITSFLIHTTIRLILSPYTSKSEPEHDISAVSGWSGYLVYEDRFQVMLHYQVKTISQTKVTGPKLYILSLTIIQLTYGYTVLLLSYLRWHVRFVTLFSL